MIVPLTLSTSGLIDGAVEAQKQVIIHGYTEAKRLFAADEHISEAGDLVLRLEKQHHDGGLVAAQYLRNFISGFRYVMDDAGAGTALGVALMSGGYHKPTSADEQDRAPQFTARRGGRL